MNSQNTSRPFKGLHQDTSPIDQPKGSYTQAWNAINETSDGNNNFISNEGSNELCGNIPSGYYPIGDVYTTNGETIIFSTNGTNSEIGIVDMNCNYTTLVNNTCLNFKLEHQIDAIFRIRRGCDRTIYFTDGLNPVRYYNLEKPEDFKDEFDEWDCELFNLFLPYQNPCFSNFEIKEEGSLKSGVYEFAIQYLDNDLNPTKFTYVSLPIPIYQSLLSVPYDQIIGSSNIDTDSLGGSASNTAKSIKIFLDDMDTTYPFFRFAVIESTSFSGGVTRALLSGAIPITGESLDFTYDGNESGFTSINVNDIRIQPQAVDAADHIEQLENRLILANTKGKQLDFCSFQQYASAISSKYIVQNAPANTLGPGNDVGLGNSKDPYTYWFARGYMGDEVYAFGIVYVFKDGFESPAYHIPGTGIQADCENPCVSGTFERVCLQVNERPTLNPGCEGDPTEYTLNYSIDAVPQTPITVVITDENSVRGWYDVVCVEGSTITNVTLSVSNDNCTARVSETEGSGWRIVTTEITITCPDDVIGTWNENIAHLYPDEAAYNALPQGSKLKYWQVYNTAQPINSNSGYMSYWESPNSVYPELLDCNNNDFWGVDACGNPLSGTPIRHHRFPDRNIERHYVNQGTTESYQSTLVIKIVYAGNQTALDTLLQEQFVGDPNKSEELTINYNLDGVAQTAITIRLYASDFNWNGTSFDPVYKTIVTRIGTTNQGIDNVVYSNTFGTDINTTITNVSTINGESVSPLTSLEVRNLGIQFDNIVYPHPDIVGHYIVRADRDSTNRTVIDKGISNSTHQSSAKGVNYNLFSYFIGGPSTVGGVINRSDNYNYLFTPEFLFNQNAPKGTYLKQEQQFYHVHTWGFGNESTPEEFDSKYEFGAGVGKSAALGSGYATLSTIRKLTYAGMLPTTPAVKIRAINKSIVLNGLTYDDNFIAGRRLYNVSHTNKVQIVDIATSMNGDGTYNIPYVTVKIDRDIYPNLFSIQYYRTHNCVLTNGTPNNVFGGDTFIGPMELSNTLFYQFNDTVWDTVLIIAAIIIAVVITVFTAGAAAAPAGAGIAAGIGALAGASLTVLQTGIIVSAIVAGAIGITAAAIDQAIKSYRESGLQEVVTEDTELQPLSYSTKNFMEYASEHLAGIYVESTINLGLRQEHTIYSPGNFYRGQIEIAHYFRDKIVVFDESATELKDQWVHRGAIIPEVYHYNPDFSKMNKENVYSALPESYDCCSECIEHHPTRVHYSEQSFQEESSDNYRVFLANNYRDIEAENGEITNVFRKHNNLFLHTKEALWQLPQQFQERITGDLVSFIGTGEYFGIPPRKILDAELGTAGSISKWATIKTDTGIFFIDETKRDIFLLGNQEGLKSILDGLRNFFKNNLVSFLGNQFYSLTGEEFPNLDNHANPNGVGYHSVYDTRHERIIFTKRDYLILSAYTENFIIVESIDGVITGVVEGQMFYDLTVMKFGIGLGLDGEVVLFQYITLGDTTYFENKSWTISYSLLNNSWTSFHSYLPLYYYYVHNKFYSTLTNEIWRHNRIGHYQTFYGTLYPHILEYISLSNPLVTRLWEEIMLHSIARSWDNTNQEFIDVEFVTFNKAVFYNSRQCSGLLTLVVKDNNAQDYLQNQIKNISGQITLDRNERNWTLNEIRDYRIDYTQSIWDRSWSSIQSEFPIDKVLNTSSISFSKNWQELQQLRDKYLIVRLIFDNFDDINLTTQYSLERETISFR